MSCAPLDVSSESSRPAMRQMPAREGTLRSICQCWASGSQPDKRRGHGNNAHGQILSTFRMTQQFVKTVKITALGRCDFALKKICCREPTRRVSLQLQPRQLSNYTTATGVKLRSRWFIQIIFRISRHRHGLQITLKFGHGDRDWTFVAARDYGSEKRD